MLSAAQKFNIHPHVGSKISYLNISEIHSFAFIHCLAISSNNFLLFQGFGDFSYIFRIHVVRAWDGAHYFGEI